METILFIAMFIICYIYEKKIKIIERELSNYKLLSGGKQLKQFKQSTPNPNILKAVTLAKMAKGGKS